jgi:hypothetical protein
LFYPFGKGIGAIDPPDIEVFTWLINVFI